MEPTLSFTLQLKGVLTFHDLLSTEGMITFITNVQSIKKNGSLFSLLSDNYIFSLAIENESIVLQRNETVNICTLNDLHGSSNRLRIIIIWTFTKLVIDCGYTLENRKIVEVETKPCAPPADLIRWARLNDLVKKEPYFSEEMMRNTILSALQTVNKKISESDSYKSFLNITYDGNKIEKKEPKRETEIQPLIHCILSDIFLVNSIEVIPEHKTGQGNIDFAFIGYIEGIGIKKFCAEFKLAHSDDLENGLLSQLPTYMKICNAQYGAYCVLNFMSENDILQKYNGQHIDFYLDRLGIDSGNPFLRNV